MDKLNTLDALKAIECAEALGKYFDNSISESVVSSPMDESYATSLGHSLVNSSGAVFYDKYFMSNVHYDSLPLSGAMEGDMTNSFSQVPYEVLKCFNYDGECHVRSSFSKGEVMRLCDSSSCGFDVDIDKYVTTCAVVNHEALVKLALVEEDCEILTYFSSMIYLSLGCPSQEVELIDHDHLERQSSREKKG
ncbi:hypothetical protein K7X08_032304 [Anisodus acutangulus]|uniref:Uncharacterized protein n=1 Tax=Anisodus acutangulus TaxID=402998 RepID=A0A9Q1LNN8_9SOLA|nr:hypothetical protein K7X08_032304 [Anisodus acutangulus]